MEKDMMESLLCELLDCGYADLSILDDCKYDLSDVIERTREIDETLTINNLCWGMFQLGFDEIQEFITNRIDELESLDELTEEEQQELEDIKTLEVQEDIETFHNFIDTHVWFRNNADIYKKYCDSALDHFEDMTGYCVGN